MEIVIINGPNLNLVGQREPEHYGNTSFAAYLEALRSQFPAITISYFQSNIEGELITKIQEVGFTVRGIILNAAAYTHTSVGIADAVKAVTSPVVEVHLSNVFAREPYRHLSYIAPHAAGLISGFGLKSYELAIRYFIDTKL